ncbi:MAG: right-handed parallel beta-helix repeat-containing protein, partial [Deltaproteobacteria bacterium]|nr:right-handed parallel beta-helix repeat-containing protein [Deltaproteobacteria bacterium]
PRVALDGRQEKQILLLSEHNRVALEKLIFLDGKSDLQRHGGAIWFWNSEPGGELIVSECVFKNNNASGNWGGAIYVGNLSRFAVFRSVFEGNHSVSGGALYMHECPFDIVDSVFIENKAGGDGGAIFMNTKTTEATSAYLFKGNEFTINRAEGDGSAILIQQAEHIETRVDQCQFFRNIKQSENLSGVGGAMCVFGGMLRLQSSSFLENKSEYAAAGVYIKSNNGLIAENCTFFANRSEQGKGGAIYQADETPSVIRNCTFLRNQGGVAGAIYREETQNLSIVSSLFAYNTVVPFVSRSCSGTFVDSSVGSSSNLQYEEYPAADSINCTSGILLSEPMVDEPQKNGGFVFTCAIESNSPARGIGVDCAAMDARGLARDNSAQSCDAGAFEYLESDALSNDMSNASQPGL